jgi:hypothetical protein
MEVSGKILVLSTFAIGFAMAAGAWVYHYGLSRRSADFWGAEDAALVIGGREVALLELADPGADGAREPLATAGGRSVLREHDLTDKKGLVHLRHALTYDGNFDWPKRQEIRGARLPDVGAWRYALRFTRGDSRVDAFFTQDFAKLAAIDETRNLVRILPCPQLGPVLLKYLDQVGISLAAGSAR